MTAKSLVPTLAALALFACAAPSGEDEERTVDPTAGQAMLQTEPEACNLQQSGLAYPTPACTTCMQTECCSETTACFGKTNGGCSAFHACLLQCPVGAAVVLGSGGEAGNPCVDGCETKYASSIPKHDTYEACIRAKCMPACDS